MNQEKETKGNSPNQTSKFDWLHFGLPKRHLDFVLPKEGEWLSVAENIARKFKEGFLIVLMGKRGTGKTQMSVMLIQHAISKAGITAGYFKAMEIFFKIREGFNDDRSEFGAVKEFITIDFLVIDAIEVRGGTPFEDRILDYIIDKRYDSMLDTLLITNQTAEAFQKSIGSSVISRIRETGKRIICDWESFRK